MSSLQVPTKRTSGSFLGALLCKGKLTVFEDLRREMEQGASLMVYVQRARAMIGWPSLRARVTFLGSGESREHANTRTGTRSTAAFAQGPIDGTEVLNTLHRRLIAAGPDLEHLGTPSSPGIRTEMDHPCKLVAKTLCEEEGVGRFVKLQVQQPGLRTFRKVAGFLNTFSEWQFAIFVPKVPSAFSPAGRVDSSVGKAVSLFQGFPRASEEVLDAFWWCVRCTGVA